MIDDLHFISEWACESSFEYFFALAFLVLLIRLLFGLLFIWNVLLYLWWLS